MPRQREGEGHVLEHRHVRIQGVALENHGQAPLGRGDIVGQLAANMQLAIRDVFQPGDHAQQGRFAAAGRSHEDDEFAVADIEVDAVDDGVLVVVQLDDVL